MGLGFVLSFGYWCTDFLGIQRAMAADSMASARRVPLIASVPKMLALTHDLTVMSSINK
jgi:SSS family solute:Na+ symporter